MFPAVSNTTTSTPDFPDVSLLPPSPFPHRRDRAARGRVVPALRVSRRPRTRPPRARGELARRHQAAESGRPPPHLVESQP